MEPRAAGCRFHREQDMDIVADAPPPNHGAFTVEKLGRHRDHTIKVTVTSGQVKGVCSRCSAIH